MFLSGIVSLFLLFADLLYFFFFFFNDPATTEIYTLSLHDALPIFGWTPSRDLRCPSAPGARHGGGSWTDRKSTRLNSSHRCISYAVFCLKKKKLFCETAKPLVFLTDVEVACIHCSSS